MSAFADCRHSAENAYRRLVPCMDGARSAREKSLTFRETIRVQPCIRPLNAAVVAAGPDVITDRSQSTARVLSSRGCASPSLVIHEQGQSVMPYTHSDSGRSEMRRVSSGVSFSRGAGKTANLPPVLRAFGFPFSPDKNEAGRAQCLPPHLMPGGSGGWILRAFGFPVFARQKRSGTRALHQSLSVMRGVMAASRWMSRTDVSARAKAIGGI
jgi:hypothetical protein